MEKHMKIDGLLAKAIVNELIGADDHVTFTARTAHNTRDWTIECEFNDTVLTFNRDSIDSRVWQRVVNETASYHDSHEHGRIEAGYMIVLGRPEHQSNPDDDWGRFEVRSALVTTVTSITPGTVILGLVIITENDRYQATYCPDTRKFEIMDESSEVDDVKIIHVTGSAVDVIVSRDGKVSAPCFIGDLASLIDAGNDLDRALQLVYASVWKIGGTILFEPSPSRVRLIVKHEGLTIV
jgi:hypothetical protein